MYQVFNSVKNWWKTSYGPHRGKKKKNSNINEEEYIILKIQENYISGKSDLWEEAK